MSKADVTELIQMYADADLLYNKAEVESAIQQMAASITAELSDQNPVVFCVMNGGMVISGQLLTHLDFLLECSYLHATRYRQATTGGSLEWKIPPMADFVGRPVLIVDDILDEGHTLVEIIRYLEEAGAQKVYTAVLIDKVHDRKAQPGLKANFTGLSIPDRYIFGYGMDYKGYWRNAPGIFAVKGL